MPPETAADGGDDDEQPRGSLLGRALGRFGRQSSTPPPDDGVEDADGDAGGDAPPPPPPRRRDGIRHRLSRFVSRDRVSDSGSPSTDAADADADDNADNADAEKVPDGAATPPSDAADTTAVAAAATADVIGRLRFVVQRAESIPVADRTGRSDPYCVVSLEGQEATTRVVQQTLEPVWDEAFEFVVTQPFSRLTVKLYDHDVLSSNDLLALTSIDLPRGNRPHEAWYPLQSARKGRHGGGDAGSIALALHYDYSAWRHFASHFSPITVSEETFVSPESEPLKFSVLLANVDHAKHLFKPVVAAWRAAGLLMTWANPRTSTVAFVLSIAMAQRGWIAACAAVLLACALLLRRWTAAASSPSPPTPNPTPNPTPTPTPAAAAASGSGDAGAAASPPQRDLDEDEDVGPEDGDADEPDDAKEGEKDKEKRGSSRSKTLALLRRAQNTLGRVCAVLESARDVATWRRPRRTRRVVIALLVAAAVTAALDARALATVVVVYVFAVNAAFRRWPKLHRSYRRFNPMFRFGARTDVGRRRKQ